MTRLFRLILCCALLGALPAPSRAAGARPALAWPVRDPATQPITGPSYVSDRIELRLAPAAAAEARSLRDASPAGFGSRRVARLGLAAVDRAAVAIGGVGYEAEFAGEAPPAVDSGDPDFTAFWILHLAPGADLAGALARLRAEPSIASADPIAVLPVSIVPNDSLFAAANWFFQPSRHDIHAPEAWNVTVGDTSVVVAVLDTGVLPNHPDLSGRVAGLRGNLWTNWRERGGVAGVDDDGNGFVDDEWGWDFVSLPTNDQITDGEDWQDADNDPSDFAGHGTIVSGLIGAVTDNTIGVSGTVWNTRLMPIRVAYSTLSNPLGLVDMSFAAQGIRYAARNGASVINCSFATLDLAGLFAAADAARRAGVTIVVAAGNSGQPQDLGTREEVVNVTATDASDLVAGFSNLSDDVDLAAPGVDLASTFITRTAIDSIGQRQPYYASALNGTSFSAPLASGAVALLQAKQKLFGSRPLSPSGVVLRLRETADDISALNVGSPGFGTGRLNLYRALTDPAGGRAGQMGAPSIGPAVVLPSVSGQATIAVVTANQRLTILDARTGDTLRVQPLPGQPARQLAAADLGGALGVGLFVGTINGKVAGFDRNGVPLPGWPVAGASAFYAFTGGPALGSLDGGAAPQIVAGSSDGSVYAWNVDGSTFGDFPIALDPNGVNVPIALGNLDGAPGVEIVAATGDNSIHALRADGNELPGWPVLLSAPALAPVIAHFGDSTSAILIAAGDSLIAFRPDGGRRFAVALGGTAAQDPALADLAGDGSDDVIVALGSPDAIAVFDSAGVVLTARNWPHALAAPALGAPIVGPLHAGGARDVMLDVGSRLNAFTDLSAPITQFPEPGRAGFAPTLADLNGNGSTSVVAGTGPDSVLYLYSAGPGTWQAGAPWPTARGNFARTGNRGDAPTLSPLDDVPPSAIANLAGSNVAPDSIRLQWTAPGNDGTVGRATQYQLAQTTVLADAPSFLPSETRTDLPAPDSAGTSQQFDLRTSVLNTPVYFCIRAADAAAHVGGPSNVVSMATPLGGPFSFTSLAPTSSADSSVTVAWQTPVAGSPSQYEIVAVRLPHTLLDLEAATPQIRRASTPGAAGETQLIHGLDSGKPYDIVVFALDSAGVRVGASNVVGAVPGNRPPQVTLAVRAQPSRVPVEFLWTAIATPNPRVDIYDVSGRRLTTLQVAAAGAEFGSILWDGRDGSGRVVRAGLYFARISSGPHHAVARVVLLP